MCRRVPSAVNIFAKIASIATAITPSSHQHQHSNPLDFWCIPATMSRKITVPTFASIETRLAETICAQQKARHPPPKKVARRRRWRQWSLLRRGHDIAQLQASIDRLEGDDSEDALVERDHLIEMRNELLLEEEETNEADEAVLSQLTGALDIDEAPRPFSERGGSSRRKSPAKLKIEPAQDGYHLSADEETLIHQTTDDMVLALLRQIRVCVSFLIVNFC
jgi:hypothetical protein